MGNLTKNTITRGAVVALALSAGAATTANAAVTRVAGGDRISTAKEIFNAWPTTPDAVVIAAANDHDVDALTVAPLAASKKAPIVLVNASNPVASLLANYTTAQMAAIKTVYIANGVGVISADVEAQLKAVGVTNVIRLGGSDRTATALNIAKLLPTSNSIVVANGDDSHLVDTLSIASIAAAKGMPIFLTSGGKLSVDELNYAKGLGATNVYALGGTSVVSDEAVAGLGTVTRLGGSGRYETNALVLNKFKADFADKIFVASGKDANLIDALAGAPLAGLVKAPIAFADDSISSDVATFLAATITDKTEIKVLGGSGAVSNSVETAINAIQATKAPVVTTEIANVTLTSPLSAQAVVGTKGVVTAKATDKAGAVIPGAKVTFEVTTPLQSQNPQYKVTVVADANGIATLTNADGKAYVRNAADADTIVAYSDTDSSKRSDVAKIYWGVNQILTVTSDTPVSATDGGSITYTVKLNNPVLGEAMADRFVRVVFQENIKKDGTQATATSYSVGNTQYGVRLFQEVNNQYSTLVLRTNADGIAKFTVTGNHDTATPVVFYDDDTFYNKSLYDSSQYLASFAGNNNGKFDPRELNVVAPKAVFIKAPYTFESDITTDSFCTSTNYATGKRYVVTVKKADGSAYAGGTINVGINELLSGYDTRARIIATATGSVTDGTLLQNTFSAGTLAANGVFTDSVTTTGAVLNGTVTDGSKVTKTAIKLDGSGKATIIIASDRINTTATPVIWVDGDTSAMYSGKTNGQYDSTLDTLYKLKTVTFVNSYIETGKLTVSDDATTAGSVAKNAPAPFEYNLYDQSGTKKAQVGHARLNYVIVNTGNDDLTVDLSVFTAGNIVVDQKDTDANTIVIVKPNQYRTVAGDIVHNTGKPVLNIRSTNETSGASVSVTASAVIYSADLNTALDVYTLPTTATANFAAGMWTQASLINGIMVGKTDDVVAADGSIRINLDSNRYIKFDLSNVTTTQAFSGLTSALSDTVNLIDFTKALQLSNDYGADISTTDNLLTVKEKIAAALGKGAAVQITFEDVVIDPATGEAISYTIDTIKIIYAAGMYDESRKFN